LRLVNPSHIRIIAKRRKLDFEVDKLTNSIENALSGERFETEIVKINDEQSLLSKSKGWAFDWIYELNYGDREVLALVIKENPSEYQGLVNFTDKGDHIFMELLESAPVNKGHGKRYMGVPANLVAFLCKKSFEKGYRGSVAFVSKSNLIEHYEKMLGAKRFAANRMFIDSKQAYEHVHRYFPEYFNDRL